MSSSKLGMVQFSRCSSLGTGASRGAEAVSIFEGLVGVVGFGLDSAIMLMEAIEELKC